MKSKKNIYFFTIFSILYFIAFFQSSFAQTSSCKSHGFRILEQVHESPFPETWHFFSPDTVLIFNATTCHLYHNFRSNDPKRYTSFLLTDVGSDPSSNSTEAWTTTDLSFVNSKVGFAAAFQYTDNPSNILPNTLRGGLFKTTDGGISWIKIKGDSSLLTHGFQKFEIRNNIFYALSGGNFIQSTDEGLTWTIVGAPQRKNGKLFGFRFYFIDDSTVIIGGENALAKSIDGGKTWRTTWEGDGNFTFITFFGKKRGYALGGIWETYTYQTEDGGESWHVTNFGLPDYLHSNLNYLYKVNDSTAYGTGENMRLRCISVPPDGKSRRFGFLAKTMDAGKTWKFFYTCPIFTDLDWDFSCPFNPLLVWAYDKPDSCVFIISRTQVYYSGHGGEYTSIEENLKENYTSKFTVYPNPATSHILLESEEGIKTVSMYDPLGRRVLFKESSLEHAMKLDLHDFPRGIYLLQVETDGGRVTQRVVVE